MPSWLSPALDYVSQWLDYQMRQFGCPAAHWGEG